MTTPPAKIDLEQWGHRYAALRAAGLVEPSYGGDLARHLRDGDSRLKSLLFDNSPAALRLWNFLLSEETRLAAARAAGGKLVGVMKDLGTVPVLAYSLPNVVAFYPDGRSDAATLQLTGRQGEKVAVACDSPAERFHVVTAEASR